MNKAGFDKYEDHIILPFGKKVSYGLGGMVHYLLQESINNLVILYNVIFKMDALIVGAILFLPRIWDAISDPLMGYLSDNTRTRWGRRRPYIFLGGILGSISLFMMMSPPLSLSQNGLSTYFLITSILFFTAFTIFIVPYNALGFEMSIDYNERSRVMGYRAFFSSFGIMLAYWMIWFVTRPIFTSQAMGAKLTGIAFALIGSLGIIIVVLRTREPADVQQQEKVGILDALKFTYTNRPFLILSLALVIFQIGLAVWLPLMTYVNFYYVFGGDISMGSLLGGLSATLFCILKLGSVPLMTWVGTKIGKDKTFGIGIVLTAVCFGLVWFLFTPKYPYLQLALQLIVVWALPSIEIFPQAIMADICDLDELKHGYRREGMFGAGMGFAQKLGVSASPLIVGIILSFIGFDQNLTVQPEEVLFKLRLFAVVVPCAFILVAGILLFAIRLPETRVREVRAMLEERRSDNTSKEEYKHD